MVISPLYNDQNKKVGLVNFKVDSRNVNAVIDRTSRDALIILIISVFVVILMLLNHLRYFEQSLLVNKLQQIDKMKDDFISVASHELKTPLTAIRGCVSMIQDKLKDTMPADTIDWFNLINSSVDRLNSLVNDLLNVSRIEQNRLAFDISLVNTNVVIEDVVKQLNITATNKSLTLTYTPPPTPLIVMANEARLREVMINLIGNAIKYTITGGVTIKPIREGKNIRISVQDTGVGISPEDKEKLFQKFSRIYNEKTEDVPGSGLGLWITKAMIERMHGKIYVDSILDQGTVFTVVLPAASLPN